MQPGIWWLHYTAEWQSAIKNIQRTLHELQSNKEDACKALTELIAHSEENCNFSIYSHSIMEKEIDVILI